MPSSPAPVASMTGSGSAVLDHELGRFEAEARSVNHRFLKTSIRTWGPLPSLDTGLETAVKARIRRGHVHVQVRFTPTGSAAGDPVDEEAFASAAERLRHLAAAHGLGAPDTGDVLRMPGVLADARAPTSEDSAAPALEAAGAALDALQAARTREGAAMAAELAQLASDLRGHVVAVAERADQLPGRVQERLHERLDALLQGSETLPDPAQVAREAALLADRADIREEIARLEAHLEHLDEILAEGGAVGRRLDFLVQEMHRETSTIGSKAQDLELGRHVLDMKQLVERLREQVQNLE